jgi:hypothetical protein
MRWTNYYLSEHGLLVNRDSIATTSSKLEQSVQSGADHEQNGRKNSSII